MFKSLVCSLFLCLTSFASQADGGAVLDEVNASDAREVRRVVEAQLRALGGDKPTDAFLYASPEIKSQFPDATAFVQMVRRGYPMLIRPVSIGFTQPEAADGSIVQAVQLHDREGHFWRAIYDLRQQPDKSWRINGCVVAPDDDSSTT